MNFRDSNVHRPNLCSLLLRYFLLLATGRKRSEIPDLKSKRNSTLFSSSHFRELQWVDLYRLANVSLSTDTDDAWKQITIAIGDIELDYVRKPMTGKHPTN